MRIRSMEKQNLAGKRVMMRCDLNVPIEDGRITDDTRIRAAVPGIRQALDAGAAVLVLSHLGRPTEGKFDPQFSLAPVARALGELLGQKVPLAQNWLTGVDVSPGQVVMCENVRFNPGEKGNSEKLAEQMAQLADVFVMDAFGTAHRAQASTEGVAHFVDVACAGPLLLGELNALGTALNNPARPLLAIVGGSKVSGKLEVLDSLARQVDSLIVGGGIANTFIAAAGFNVGQSLYEPDLVDEAQRIIATARMNGGEVPIPPDVVVASRFAADAEPTVKSVDQVRDQEMILDVGPKTRQRFKDIVNTAGTIVWNGPLGVFEFEAFAEGTKALAEAIADSRAYSIAGGGDTLAAISKFGITNKISYISTGGGAFLEFLRGSRLPAIKPLEISA